MSVRVVFQIRPVSVRGTAGSPSRLFSGREGRDGLAQRARLSVAGAFAVLLFSLLLPSSHGMAQVLPEERQALLDLYASTNGPGWISNAGWGGPEGTECTWAGVYCGGGPARGAEATGTVTALMLPSNNLSGPLPASISGLSGLFDLNLYNNLITGPLPASLASLTNLSNINLGLNRLTGSIPPAIGNLPGLYSFLVDSNALTGEIPSGFQYLTYPFLGFGYNGLYTTDPALKTFLDSWVPGWDAAQTIAPVGVTALALSAARVEVSWDPVAYTADPGYCVVEKATSAGGPYSTAATTSSKSETSVQITNLTPGTTYYLRVRTVTSPHSLNENTVISDPSAVVSAATPACTYALLPTSINVPIGGLSGAAFQIETQTDCPWIADTNESWITLFGGGGPQRAVRSAPDTNAPITGSGAATVLFDVASNPAGPRTGIITAAGLPFTVYQAGTCTYSFTPLSTVAPGTGATGLSFAVSVQSGCTWTATTTDSWISLTAAGGTGPGTVTFNVAANPGSQRTGSIHVGGASFTVYQDVGCVASLNPVSVNVGATQIDDLQFQVVVPFGCSWSAASNATWVTINSGATGTGTGIVSLKVLANAGPARSGTVTAAGLTFTVNQASGCSTVLVPSSLSVPATASTGLSFALQTGAGCAWTAASNSSWITLTSAGSGSGPATVTFNAAANSGPARTGTVTAGGQTFTVSQASGCSIMLEPSSASLGVGGASNATFSILTGSGCPWLVTPSVSWILLNSASQGSGPATVSYSVLPNSGSVRSGFITAGEATFTVSQAACSVISVVPTVFNVSHSGATSLSIAVTAEPSCPWIATTSDSWISLTAPDGSGSGSVRFNVAANASQTPRAGTIRIRDLTVVVNQGAAPCDVTLQPSGSSVPSDGAEGSFTVVTSAGCSWTARPQVSWLSIVSGGSGSGTGTVRFRASSNSAGARTGRILVGDAEFLVSQSACDKAATPQILSAPQAPVVAGNPIVVSWAPVSGAVFLVAVSENADCTSPVTLQTSSLSVSIPTSPAADATYCIQIRAVKDAACPSDPVTVQASALRPPATFTVVVPPPALVAELGAAPPAGVTMTLKNTGGAASALNLSGTPGLFVPSPASVQTVAPGGEVVVTLLFDASLTASPGLKSGSLGAVWAGGSLDSPVLVNVVQPFSAPDTGAKFSYVDGDVVRFSAPLGTNPAPQTVTIRNIGTAPALVVPRIGPEGIWLSLSGDFGSPLPAGMERTFEVAVDRSRRPAESPSIVSTTLVFAPSPETPGGEAFGQVFDEALPASGPGANRQSLSPEQFSVFLTSAVTAPGMGASFVSGAWIRNQGSTKVTVTLYWTPDGADGQTDPSVRKNSMDLAPYTTYSLADLVKGLFGLDGVSGQVEIRSPDLSQLSIRTTTDSIKTSDSGALARYGAEIPIVLSGQGVQGGGQARGASPLAAGDIFAVLGGLRDPEAGYRTNIILSETSGKSAGVRVTLYNVDGQKVGEKFVSLRPYSKTQVNSTDRELFPPGVRFDGGTAEVVSESGSGSVAAFATVIDNLSGSFAARTGELFQATDVAGSARKLSAPNASLPAFLPAAVRAKALNESFYTTRVSMTNLSRSAIKVTMTFLPDKGIGTPVEREVTIPARAEGPRAVVFPDVVGDLFQIENDTRGMVRLDGALAPIAVVSETSTPIDLGDPSKGRSLSAVNPAPGKPITEEFGTFSRESSEVIGTAASGSPRVSSSFPAVEDGVGFRTNLILAEVEGESVDVRVKVIASGQDGAVLGEKVYSLGPFERFQQNRVVRDVLGVNESPIRTEFRDLELRVEAVSGAGRVLAIATRIDNNPASKRADIFTLGGTVSGSPLGFGN
ncbi:MAG: hypothetical protein DIJKHBIC_01937 [Thermoanaerobaculia bacterium]|nr:hypothetical protein [Thermoanaerobaculia bacterium]